MTHGLNGIMKRFMSEILSFDNIVKSCQMCHGSEYHVTEHV